MTRRPGLASKYFAAQTLLTGNALGVVVVAGVTHPHSAPLLGPAALVLGVMLGYGWRDAVGEWHNQRRAIRLAESAERRTRELLESAVGGGVIPIPASTVAHRLAMGIPVSPPSDR